MVFAVWPATLTLVELYLTVIGIPFYSIRAAYSQPQRQNAILKFNDPSDPVKILLCSSRSAATSFNAQRSCADMIILEIPWNLSTVDQMVGRLWRVGQDKEVKVHILVVDFTYNQVIQARATRKVIAQLASQAEASDRKAEGNAAPVGPTIKDEMTNRCISYYMRIYGFRSPRHEWNNHLDLSAKDNLLTEKGFCTTGKPCLKLIAIYLECQRSFIILYACR